MPKRVTCPHCGRPVIWGDASPFRPFCSERCRLIDLGGWLEETYRIANDTNGPIEDPPASDGSSQAGPGDRGQGH